MCNTRGCRYPPTEPSSPTETWKPAEVGGTDFVVVVFLKVNVKEFGFFRPLPPPPPPTGTTPSPSTESWGELGDLCYTMRLSTVHRTANPCSSVSNLQITFNFAWSWYIFIYFLCTYFWNTISKIVNTSIASAYSPTVLLDFTHSNTLATD